MELAGNVAEWTGDRYGPYPDAPQTNPTGPDEGRLRVVRGGGWLEGRRWLRTSARWGAAPEHRSANIGFRCVWREDLDPSSVLRGPLTAPADRGRVTDHGPQTSPVAGPEVLASGFGDPIDVVAADGALFVLDAAHGELVRVEMSGESTVVVDALAQPRGLATDRQGVYIASGDRILRWDGATTQEVAAAQQDLTGTIVADADGVYWIAGDTLRGREFGDMVSREATVTGPVALALTDTHLIFTTDGDDDPAQTLVGQMARDDAAVETIYLFGSNLSPLYPSHVRVDRDSGEVSFLARFRSFPNNAYLATDTLATRLTYSPPTDAGRLLAFEGQVYWPTRNSLVRHDTRAIGTTFSYVTPYSDVGGLWTSAAGVVWTDRVTGRLLRAPHEN